MQDPSAASFARPISVGLNAAIIAIRAQTPIVLEVNRQRISIQHGIDANDGEGRDSPSDAFGALPFGPFDPNQHRTLEAGLRAWVQQQTGLRLGYVEQLYTFGDRGRQLQSGESGAHEVSIGYLALSRLEEDEPACSDGQLGTFGGCWSGWYDHFPWEDWRDGRPVLLDQQVLPALQHWADTVAYNGNQPLSPKQRLQLAFGVEGAVWDEERVLERYELLYEAGLVLEHHMDRGGRVQLPPDSLFGKPMQMDHRRILATAISRLRSKLKYRPLVFELMPEQFTLTDLQETVEAISGRHLHKQNFRRLVEQGQLVKPTGATRARTGGRPAKLFRFRRSVMVERPAPGLRVGGTTDTRQQGC